MSVGPPRAPVPREQAPGDGVMHARRRPVWTRVVVAAAVIVLSVVAAFGFTAVAPGVVRAQATPPTVDQLRNATYPSEFTADRTAPLVDGAYGEAAAPGSASMVTVTFIDAAIAGDFAAVVLATSGGGSGTFYTLHLVSSEGGALSAGAGTLLGDRIVLHSIAIDGATVRVALTAHAVTDPLCCPTQEETRVYGFDATGFGLLSTTPGPGLPPAVPAPADTGSAGLAAPAPASATALALAVLLAIASVVAARLATTRPA